MNFKFKYKFFLGLFVLVVIIGFIIIIQFNKTKKEGEVRFGFITDVHCYSKFNKDLNDWEVNWRCSRPLGKFVNQMNNSNFKPDFVIENGDFVDGKDKLGEDGFLKAKKIYDEINSPKFHVLGNHETNNFTKERWKEITGHERTYYYFDLKGYRFIVLDGNYKTELDGSIVDTSPENHSYQGFLGDDQSQWLEKTLKESNDKKVLVFMHQPPLSKTIGRSPGDISVNPGYLQELFSKHNVLAVFSGHIEENCNLEIKGVKYFTFQGFHKRNEALDDEYQFKDKGVFYQISIRENDVDIEMFFSDGRDEEYKSVEFGEESVICNNKSVFGEE